MMGQVCNTSSPYVLFVYVQHLVIICHSSGKFGVMPFIRMCVLLRTLTLNACEDFVSLKRSSSSSTQREQCGEYENG